MKKVQKSFALSLAVGILFLCLFGCAEKGAQFGTDEQGRTMNEKTGDVYLIAPDCFAPIAIEEAVYGSSSSNVYHAVTGADPAKWLYGEQGMLFYATDVTLPTLEQMAIDRVSVLDSAGVAVGALSDTAEVLAAVLCYTEGTNETYLGVIQPLRLYTLRFEDSSLGICYVVNYLEYQGETEEERVAYLYCRSERRFVAVSDSLQGAVEAVIGVDS